MSERAPSERSAPAPGGDLERHAIPSDVDWSQLPRRGIIPERRCPRARSGHRARPPGALRLRSVGAALVLLFALSAEARSQWSTTKDGDAEGAPRSPGVMRGSEGGFRGSSGTHTAATFATGELVCVDMDGERAWAEHVGVPRNPYGHASSLASDEELLFVQFDQRADSRLLAFDFETGAPAWSAKRDAASWASPILIEDRGRAGLVLVRNRTVDGYAPATGERLWSIECLDGEVASSAAYSAGVVFVASEGATTSAIDIRGHDTDPKILWQWDESLPDTASPLAKDGYLIVPTAFGVVTCLEAESGRVLWEEEFDRGFSSSPVAARDRVYMVDESGATQVFRRSDTFESLGASEIGEKVYATPAVVGDRIYIRGLTYLYCVAAKPE